MAQVFLTPKRDHVKTQTIWIFLYFFKCNPKRNMMAFCPEHPKSDQNPKFTPLSETKSIPTPFICRVPPPGVDVRIIVTSAQNTCQGKHAIALCYHKHYDRMRERHAAVAMNEVSGDWKNWGLFFYDLFQACALSSPVAFLTGDHVHKSDLTSSHLRLVNKRSGIRDYCRRKQST